MPTSDDTSARRPGPAPDRGPDRHHHPEPARGLQLHQPVDREKLEQLGAEVEGNDDIRVLVIEGEGRAFSAGGDLQTIGAAAATTPSRPWSANC